MQDIQSMMLAMGVMFIVLLIIIYIIWGLFLNSFNKLVEGHGTILGFIPIANLYLLGKLTFNSSMGLILVLASFACSAVTTKVNGVYALEKFIPKEILDQILTYYSIVVLAVFLIGVLKYLSLRFTPKEDNKSFKDDNIQEKMNHVEIKNVAPVDNNSDNNSIKHDNEQKDLDQLIDLDSKNMGEVQNNEEKKTTTSLDDFYN